MSDSKVQPETSAECSLRDRYAEALREAAFLDIATEHGLTILPTQYGAHVPSHWSNEADIKADPYLDAVLAVRDDVLAEKDAECRALLALLERERAEVARLRETVVALVSALERTARNLRLAVQSKPVRDMTENLAENEAALRAALAPRESATEAPRILDVMPLCDDPTCGMGPHRHFGDAIEWARDGEQGGERCPHVAEPGSRHEDEGCDCVGDQS